MQQTTLTEQKVPVDKALNYDTRFGEVTLREDRLISFDKGLLGFNECTTFGLCKLPNADESPIMLLQCVNEPEIGFLVADPKILGLEIKDEDVAKALKEAGMSKESTQLMVILTMYDQEDSYYLTANLRAPLLIDSRTRKARQHVLTSKDYTTQHKL
ncbi:MAG: flagellar assembly factor FliW [Alphaproteobacteria bacterium]|jgi:flagellar assembly factor FliW